MPGVGVNIAPGWGNTVYGRDLAKMRRCLADLRPAAVRMPWVNNAATIGTWQWCVDRGIEVVVTDHAYDPPEVTAEQIAAVDLPGCVEGVNEPDLNRTAGWLDAATARHTQLYDAIAGRFPVLSPAAAWRENDAALLALPHDIANVHRYASRAPTDADAALPASDKPVWVTETGWPTYKQWVLIWQVWVINPIQQRDWLVWMRDKLTANGAQRVFAYALENEGTGIFDATNPNKNWGVFTYEGAEKPAVAALRGA